MGHLEIKFVNFGVIDLIGLLLIVIIIFFLIRKLFFKKKDK